MSALACNDNLIDPLRFIELCWPEIRLYDKQAEILYSLQDAKETYVPAGNGLGKDFIAALAVLWFFCSRRPSRVVTTSVKHDQLDDVLWGEIRRFINTSRHPLPIHYNHMKIRQVLSNGRYADLTEIVGQVVNKGESILGRHLPRDIPRTLLVGDEVSGMETQIYTNATSWFHRALFIFNCFETSNWIPEAVEQGDKYVNGKLFRRVIRIQAEDSPNVQYARAQQAAGIEPTNEVLIPGLVDWETYIHRRQVWDPVMQSIGLDATFYKGAELLMFPPSWMQACNENEFKYPAPKRRFALGVGVDTASGGDNTSYCATDNYGLIALESEKTPDTTRITKHAREFALDHGCRPEDVWFDLGNGGNVHVDHLRASGFRCRGLYFGEAATDIDFFRSKRNRSRADKVEEKETRLVYKNRRAEIYGLARETINPDNGHYILPAAIVNKPRVDGGPSLRKQLSTIPLLRDDEGRLYLPPKNKKGRDDKKDTLTKLLGCSPDEADAFVLANFGRLMRNIKPLVSVTSGVA